MGCQVLSSPSSDDNIPAVELLDVDAYSNNEGEDNFKEVNEQDLIEPLPSCVTCSQKVNKPSRAKAVPKKRKGKVIKTEVKEESKEVEEGLFSFYLTLHHFHHTLHH